MTDQYAARVASRIIISFSPTDTWISEALDTSVYRAYLRRTRRGSVAVGEKWEEFVSGGCGTTRDIVLCVESIEGGNEISAQTTLTFTPRETSSN